MWEANAEWIGQRLDYQQKLAYTRLLRFSLGLWFVYLWLGGWLVIGQLGLLSSRPTAPPARRLLATWLLLLLLAISLPRYLEPISLLQSAGDWPTARRHARILGETQNLSSHRRAAEAAKQCRVFRHFPRAISVSSPWQASRIWRLIVDLDTALQPDFLDQLDELAATDFLIILAVDVDPDTLTEQQTEQLLDLQFRIIRK